MSFRRGGSQTLPIHRLAKPYKRIDHHVIAGVGRSDQSPNIIFGDSVLTAHGDSTVLIGVLVCHQDYRQIPLTSIHIALHYT